MRMRARRARRAQRTGRLMTLPLYRTLTVWGRPLIRLYLAYRKTKGKEDPVRFSERLGHAGRDRPAGFLVWAHAASVGESLSLLPLIERLLGDRPDLNILVTTGTVTSATLMAERLPAGAFHQYMPVDCPPYVRRFLDHWRPDLVLWAESEFWPNMITALKDRAVPLVLINGRVSLRSFKGWQRHAKLIGHLLSAFSLCLGQTDGDAERLRILGARDARCLGNLKFAVPPLPCDERDLEALKQAVGARPRWLAASTHPGEEEIVARVHRNLRETFPDLLTVVVPRHPERGADIARTAENAGLTAARRSANEPLSAQTDIYIADTLGELGLFFRVCEVVFMGKSLVPLGGQNPLEPAKLDCAILQGPHTANFAEMTERLKAARAFREVAGENELPDAVRGLLNDGTLRAHLIEAASTFAESESGVLDRLA
ncbi:MAG: 3-deoxy-D-manno-octulosonic acid transferase, partial [Amphiplicatus sp.]